MNIKKLAPWNWFKDEENQFVNSVPINKTQPDYGHASMLPLADVHRSIDRLFNQFFDSVAPSLTNEWGTMRQTSMLRPDIDIAATDDQYAIYVDIPGVDESDVKLELSENKLTIRGERSAEQKDERKDYYRIERSYGAFKRVLNLPEDADTDAINAKFKNGVLHICVPKVAKEKKQVKQIPVEKAA